jgi:hypothetical protein
MTTGVGRKSYPF